jgi:hypothetical protein
MARRYRSAVCAIADRKLRLAMLQKEPRAEYTRLGFEFASSSTAAIPNHALVLYRARRENLGNRISLLGQPAASVDGF